MRARVRRERGSARRAPGSERSRFAARCSRLLLFGILVVLLVPGGAEARRRLPYLRLYGHTGKLYAQLRYDRDTRRSTGLETVRENEWLLEQGFEFHSKGWLYHPALLTFRLGGGTLFDQDLRRSEPGNASSDVYRMRLSYDLNATLLPYKPYPLHFFAQRTNAEIDSPLSPRRTIDALRYGAELSLRKLRLAGWSLPTRLYYRHEDVDTSGSFGNTQARDELRFQMENETERSRSRLEYEWENNESRAGSTTETYQRSDLRLGNELEFEKGQLSSQLLATDTSSGTDVRTLTLSEAFRWRLSRSLASRLQYSLDYQDSSAASQLSHQASVALTHELYQSLSSSVTLSGSFADSDFGTTLRGSGTLGFNYTKQIPGGRLGLRFSPSYAYQREDMQGGIVSVLDERHAVRTGELIVLEHSFVRPETVVVRDAATSFLFTEGIDYEIVALGTETALRVIPGSDLDPLLGLSSGTVVVRYDFETQPSRTFVTKTMLEGFSLELFDHVLFDLSRTDTTQDVLRGIAEDSTLDEGDRTIARLDLYFPHSQTHLEWERSRFRITPRDRYGVSQSFSFRPGRRTSFGMGLRYSHDRILDPRRTSDSYAATASLTQWLPRGLLLRLYLTGRRLTENEQRSLVAGTTISLSWRFRRLEFELRDQLDWRRTKSRVGAEQRIAEVFNTVFFRISRPF